MLPKISFIYNRKHNRKVEACIYYAGKRRYLSTGVTLPENATFSNGTVARCATAPSLNKTLNSAMNSLQAQLQKQIDKEVFDISAFSLSLKSNNDSFFEWGLEKISEQKIKQSTKDELRKILTRWQEKGIENFADLTPDRIGKAVRQMEQTLMATTVRNYLTALGKFVRIALNEKIIVENPLDYVARPKGKTREINYLTREELELVENLELNPLQSKARDMFVFACYTGLAYSDLVKIRREDIIHTKGKPYIIDKRRKTGSVYKLRLLPKAMEILRRHDYNLALMKNSAANKLLASMEKKIDGEVKKKDKNSAFKKHLTMHVGRHTFATLALSSGVRIETVSRMLAHANITTTQIYAKVLQKDVDEGFDILEGKM